ncbi:MAG: hypothetical protein SPH39_04440 [Bacteroidaceae bacterium]|nr:hypothetical protein [Bacteroidaceae bacterium]
MGISSVPADNFIWARTQARGEEYSAVVEMWQERGCAAMGVLWGVRHGPSDEKWQNVC